MHTAQEEGGVQTAQEEEVSGGIAVQNCEGGRVMPNYPESTRRTLKANCAGGGVNCV